MANMDTRFPAHHNPKPRHRRGTQKITLNQGTGAWEVHFSATSDFADAIKIVPSQDTSPTTGIPASSLRFSGLNDTTTTTIIFRDARRFPVWIQKPGARPKEGQMVVAASIAFNTDDDVDIVQNYARDGTWLLVMKSKSVASWKVQPMFSSPLGPHAQDPGHGILELWRMRDRVEGMGYCRVAVRGFEENRIWGRVLRTGILGSVGAPVIVRGTRTRKLSSEGSETDHDMLEQRASEELVEMRDDATARQGGDVGEEVDSLGELMKDVAGEGMPVDPFRRVWEYAKGH